MANRPTDEDANKKPMTPSSDRHPGSLAIEKESKLPRNFLTAESRTPAHEETSQRPINKHLHQDREKITGAVERAQ